ncbi:hypothetical protein GCM10027093_73570 [Paraburkholderia jirisanensis]
MATAEDQRTGAVKRVKHADRVAAPVGKRGQSKQQYTKHSQRNCTGNTRDAKFTCLCRASRRDGRVRLAQQNTKNRAKNNYDQLRVQRGQHTEHSDRNKRNRGTHTIRAQTPCHVPHCLRDNRNRDQLEPVDEPLTDWST